jgi:DNA primase large subunit
MRIERERGLDPREQVNALTFTSSPFTKDIARMELVRLVMLRVVLYRELASRAGHKPIRDPLLDLPNLDADLLDEERAFYRCALLVCTHRQEYERDAYSHFVCRMAFCQNEGLRDYMLRHEVVIFRNKLELRQDTDFLLRVHQELTGLPSRVEGLGDAEFQEVRPHILACRPFLRLEDRESVIKMPFEMASEAYRTRDAYLKKGFCYFDKASLLRILVHCFEEHLRRCLQEITEKVQRFMEQDKDDQLTTFLKEMANLNLHPDYEY